MTAKRVIFAAILLWACLMQAPMQDARCGWRGNERAALECYKQAQILSQEGDTAQALASLKKAVWHNRDFAEAYHMMGQLYMGKGRVDDMVQARWALEEALQREPESTEILTSCMDFAFRTGDYAGAKRYGEKAVTLDQRSSRALYILGRIHEMDWIHFRNMISPQVIQEGGQSRLMGVFRLGGASSEEMEKAMECYRRAYDADPEFSNALYRLALLYYEQDELDRMTELLEEAVAGDPANSDYHLFLGLAYHRKRDFKQAWQAYNSAFERMGDEERTFLESADKILSPDSLKIFRYASAEGQKKMTDQLWRSKDPLYLTEVNERKLEHYGRVAYANLRFSRPVSGVEGWKTARGQAYIRFGPPESDYKTRPRPITGMAGTMQIGGSHHLSRSSSKPRNKRALLEQEENIKSPNKRSDGQENLPHPKNLDMFFSHETWNYSGFSLTFVDRSYNENFQHANPQDYREVINRTPEQYRLFDPDQQFPVLGTWACFQGESGKTEMEVYSYIPEGEVWHLEEDGDYKLKRGVFLFDEGWDLVARQADDRIRLLPYQKELLLLGWNRLRLNPGSYHLAVEYMEQGGERVGRWTRDLEIRDFPEGELALSDVILALEAGELREKGELRRSGLRFMPNPVNQYAVTSLVPVYFEIYNLGFGADGTTRYTVTYNLMPEKGGDHRQEGGVETAYDYQGDSGKEASYQALELEDPTPGPYTLTVRVRDWITGDVAEQKKVFTMRLTQAGY
jgi:GWxTD domain-containing protein